MKVSEISSEHIQDSDNDQLDKIHKMNAEWLTCIISSKSLADMLVIQILCGVGALLVRF